MVVGGGGKARVRKDRERGRKGKGWGETNSSGVHGALARLSRPET